MLLKLVSLYTIRHLIPLLPHGLLMKLASVTGALTARGATAAVIAAEMRRLLGDGPSDRELSRLALQTQQDFHKDLFEIWSFPRLTKRKIERITRLEGREHIDAALAKGRGVIIGVAHFGSWKIIIPALAHAGYPVHQIALSPLSFAGADKPFFHNKIMEIEYACEQSLPVNFIYVGGFMREIYRAFARNEVVISSFDGFSKKQKREVGLLHTTVPVDLGPVLLAAKQRTPLLPTFAVRQADDRHRIVIHPDIMPAAGPGAVDAAFERYLEIFAGHVREKPSHYGRILYELATKYYQR